MQDSLINIVIQKEMGNICEKQKEEEKNTSNMMTLK